MAERSIHILQMGKHFLYLPIYYAHHRAFFGYLPPNVEVVIDAPLAEHTDIAVYDQLMDESPDYRDSVMAIADPTQILRTPLSSEKLPAVLATIVTNGAFWAINHGAHEIGGLRDLAAFDQVIAYDKGTTSYNIAVRIANDSGIKKDLDKFIQIVAPGNELLRLSNQTSGSNTFALSPDILQIEEMTKRPGSTVKEELAIGTTEEYSAVIATALISSNHFVENEPEIVRGMVRGIQHALRLTRLADPDVIRFAQSYFRFADRAEGALNRAKRASVIPPNAAVERPHWMSAAKANCEANESWTKMHEANASEYYKKCIEPYQHFAEEAIAHDLVPLQTTTSLWIKFVPFAATFIAIGVTALFGWLPSFVIALTITLAWCIKSVALKGTTRLMRILSILAVAGLLTIALPFVKPFGLREKADVFIPMGAGFLVMAIIEFFKYVEREKR